MKSSTRNENILDISIINRPTLVNKCVNIPGLSNHDAVLFDSNIVPSRKKTSEVTYLPVKTGKP